MKYIQSFTKECFKISKIFAVNCSDELQVKKTTVFKTLWKTENSVNLNTERWTAIGRTCAIKLIQFMFHTSTLKNTQYSINKYIILALDDMLDKIIQQSPNRQIVQALLLIRHKRIRRHGVRYSAKWRFVSALNQKRGSLLTHRWSREQTFLLEKVNHFYLLPNTESMSSWKSILYL